MSNVKLTAADAVSRARSLSKYRAKYRDGAGGTDPHKPSPYNGDMEADCSGTIAWIVGLPRDMGNNFGSYRWIETTRVFNDASHTHILFTKVDPAAVKPGDVVVYGDSHGKEGHIGFIAAANGGKPTRVVHTTARSGLKSATVEEDFSVFWASAVKTRGAIFARPNFYAPETSTASTASKPTSSANGASTTPVVEHDITVKPIVLRVFTGDGQVSQMMGLLSNEGKTYVAIRDAYPDNAFEYELSADKKTLKIVAKNYEPGSGGPGT